ncbi:hypothetical protein ES319_D12G134500v1 [Gossypium barbadense]|uniref:Uncharacterized protein n=2 Tax=Gossypium TaxID=3633 RepID=A0A5J5P215_GOSBA|nr:hypothetical protein ES319_D12G134500v1 [Gossypium barbadense]TYG41029.1 hypothetical protein ES288_D12G142800v1 [Gossypium darwinii]
MWKSLQSNPIASQLMKLFRSLALEGVAGKLQSLATLKNLFNYFSVKFGFLLLKSWGILVIQACLPFYYYLTNKISLALMLLLVLLVFSKF